MSQDRVWRLPYPGVFPDYPREIPFDLAHMNQSFDYSDPMWKGTAKHSEGGVWVRFTTEGKATYPGAAHPAYKLEDA